jgi:hypothetical protein
MPGQRTRGSGTLAVASGLRQAIKRRRGSAPHIAQAGADVDRRCRSRWHRIGGAAGRGYAAGEKPEDPVRQKARARRHHVAAAMASTSFSPKACSYCSSPKRCNQAAMSTPASPNCHASPHPWESFGSCRERISLAMTEKVFVAWHEDVAVTRCEPGPVLRLRPGIIGHFIGSRARGVGAELVRRRWLRATGR